MSGYWHTVAIAVATVMLYIIFDQIFFLVLYVCWISGICLWQRLPLPPTVTSFLVLLGALLYLLNHQIEPVPLTETEQKSEKSRLYAGRVVSALEITSKKITFSFLPSNQKSPSLAIYFPKRNEDTQAISEHIVYGADCQFSAQQSILEPATNPGQFDFSRYIRTQGYESQIMLDSLRTIECSNGSILSPLFALRGKVLSRTSNRLEDTTVPWLHALVLGDASELPEEEMALFQGWGLSHLLAISGLHVGLIASMIYFLLVGTGCLTKEKAHWCMVVFMPLYALLAGGQPSVWRASLMVILVIILHKSRWKLSSTDIISIIFLLLVCLRPTIMYDIGFQLSFLVTFGIMLSQKWIRSAQSVFIRMLRLSFVAQMMILPVQIGYFQETEPLSIFLNIVVVPYFSFFVIPLMFAIFLLQFLPLLLFIVKPMEMLFAMLHEQFIRVLILFDQSFSTPLVPGESFASWSALYFVFFALFMCYIEQQKQWKAFLYGVFMVCVPICVAIAPYFSKVGSVVMLDMGQGDAFVIELPYRRGVILIDAGASFSFEDQKPSDKVYKQIIGPYLKSRGIQQIDAIFLSHEDLDHDGSVPFILEDMKVNEIVVSSFYKPTALLQSAIEKYHPNVSIMDSGAVKKVGGYAFYALGPLEETDSANENSLVLYTELGGQRWLFTGDIGMETEKRLLQTYPDMVIDVLKVGHHGSKHSSAPVFINQLQPQHALISAGRRNRYGHPATEVLSSLAEAGVKMYRTDKSGAIMYRFTDEMGGTFLPLRP